VPGAIHQGFVTLFHNHPKLAFELAAAAGAPLRPRDARFEHGPTEFQDPGRAGVTVHTDVVLLACERPDSRTFVDGLSIEIQGWRDISKRRTVPITRAGVCSRHECAAWSLIVCVDPVVRRWLERQLFPRRPELAPLYVRPEALPPIVDPGRARESIAHATAAAAFHARGPQGVASARATLQALLDLDLDKRESYISLISACLPEDRMKQVAQELPANYRDQLFPMERESAPYIHGREEGRKAGRKEGRKAGRKEGRKAGRKEGRKEGRVEQARRTLFIILSARSLELTPAQRARIADCNDLEQLTRWTTQAAVAEHSDEILADA
jgi:hypothetical protein